MPSLSIASDGQEHQEPSPGNCRTALGDASAQQTSSPASQLSSPFEAVSELPLFPLKQHPSIERLQQSHSASDVPRCGSPLCGSDTSSHSAAATSSLGSASSSDLTARNSLSPFGRPSSSGGGTGSALRFGTASDQGPRAHMEDCCYAEDISSRRQCQAQGYQRCLLLSVFDGHNGSEVAQFLSQELQAQLLSHEELTAHPPEALRQSVLHCEARCLDQIRCGAGEQRQRSCL